MINLQQQGYNLEEISAGLFDAVCENYIKDLTPGLQIHPPAFFAEEFPKSKRWPVLSAPGLVFR